jgi:hypothetical protein
VLRQAQHDIEDIKKSAAQAALFSLPDGSRYFLSFATSASLTAPAWLLPSALRM